jgi:hypothetical protein
MGEGENYFSSFAGTRRVMRVTKNISFRNAGINEKANIELVEGE